MSPSGTAGVAIVFAAGELDPSEGARWATTVRGERAPYGAGAGWPGGGMTTDQMTVLRVVTVMALAASPMSAQSAAKILARLDEVAPKFSAATANLTWTDHQAVVDMDEKQSGTMTVKRYSTTKTHYVVRFTDPDQYTVAVRDGSIERYIPKNNLIQEYDIKRYRDIAQTLMLLGFGTTGRELAASFEISGVRAEAVESQKATHLDLTPKSPGLRHHISHIELWISDELTCALQQKFHYPGGSYKLVTFTNLKLNPKLDRAGMALPKNAKRERVQ